MIDNLPNILYLASTWVLPAVTAITLHEAAHGWMAWKLGDDTALRAGRVSFNPARHIDPIGTIILPGLLLLMRAPFLFGFAKPVPVDFSRLRHPKRDMIWVAAAGPGANLVMAYAAAVLFYVAAFVPGTPGDWLFENLKNALLLNVVLAVFNMLPIPPLDGGRVVAGLLPYRYAVPYSKIEPYGIFIVIGLIVLPPLLGFHTNLFSAVLFPPIEFLVDACLFLAGHG